MVPDLGVNKSVPLRGPGWAGTRPVGGGAFAARRGGSRAGPRTAGRALPGAVRGKVHALAERPSAPRLPVTGTVTGSGGSVSEERAVFRNILVPLDGSPFGEHALPIAFAIARRAGGNVHLVRVHEPLGAMVPVMAGGDSGPELEQWHRRLAEGESSYLRGLTEHAGRDLRVSARLLHGIVLDALEVDAQRTPAELVVMTTHGRGGIARAWLGSVADGIVRRLNVPVLLVRPGMEPPQPCDDPCFHRIVVPLDGSRLAESVLEPAIDFARLMDARLTLLQVLPPPYFFDTNEAAHGAPHSTGYARMREEAGAYLARVTGELAGRGVQATAQVLVDPRPAHAIGRYAQESHGEMIALATHGRGGATRLLLGSVADKVVRTAPVPVLVLRPRVSA